MKCIVTGEMENNLVGKKFLDAISIFFPLEKLPDYGGGVESFYIYMFVRYNNIIYQKFRYHDVNGKPVEMYYSAKRKVIMIYQIVDYEKFKSASEEEAVSMVARAVLQSIQEYDYLPRKPKGFDRDRFYQDVKAFMIEKEFIESESY